MFAFINTEQEDCIDRTVVVMCMTVHIGMSYIIKVKRQMSRLLSDCIPPRAL